MSSTSSSSSSTSSDEGKDTRDKKNTRDKKKATNRKKEGDGPDVPAEEQQVWEFSDEELEAPDPIPEHQVRQSASCLDDLPMALHRKNASGSASASRPQKKARTGAGAQRGDPALRLFVEKRAAFDAAMKQTEKHFKAMKDRLEPKPVNVVLPTQMGSSNPELVPIPVKPAGPPYFNTHRFKVPPEEPDADQELMDALAVDLDMDVFNRSTTWRCELLKICGGMPWRICQKVTTFL